MKNYVSLERAKSVDKDALIDSAFEKFNKQNVDKDGNYVKYSDLENNFDGVTQMYEGLNELEDALIDYIEVIQTVKGVVKDKLKDGNFKTDEKVAIPEQDCDLSVCPSKVVDGRLVSVSTALSVDGQVHLSFVRLLRNRPSFRSKGYAALRAEWSAMEAAATLLQ